ncbi:unnamed protein product [Blepharisma stoltei]|uniref:Uncharacterized protein n=1 Tax=Blepharisma stoltei TaxID=1481888 RepID=A0AAU9JYW6_9CILI|nr:unnamed protein product [Blepharisma stoltei]
MWRPLLKDNLYCITNIFLLVQSKSELNCKYRILIFEGKLKITKNLLKLYFLNLFYVWQSTETENFIHHS